MDVICEICKTKCILIDGDFICQEGHVSKYVEEMADEGDVVKSSKNIKKKKEESKFLTYDDSYKHILFFNLIFCCLAEQLGIKDEKYFHYFINFLSGDRKQVYYNLKLNYTTLAVLLYLSKRDECRGELLFYNDFVDEIKKIKLDERIKHFKKLLLIRVLPISIRDIEYAAHNFLTKRDIVNQLGCEGHPLNPVEHKLYTETGLKDPRVEYNKLLFRNNLRLDLKLMIKYLKTISKLFCLKVSSEMVFYFEKFVYMREYNKIIGFPEDEVCFFLFLYNKYNAFDFDYQKAYKNVSTVFQQVVPEGEAFENILIVYLRTTRKWFYKEVHEMLFQSGCNGYSRFFFGHIFHRRYCCERRFDSIELYIKRLKALLKTKKNLKLKREYVENNMI